MNVFRGRIASRSGNVSRGSYSGLTAQDGFRIYILQLSGLEVLQESVKSAFFLLDELYGLGEDQATNRGRMLKGYSSGLALGHRKLTHRMLGAVGILWE